MRNVTLERLASERDSVNEQIDSVLAAIETDERDPSDAERELITRQRARLELIEPQIVELVELEERRGSSRDARVVLERARVANPNAPEPQRVTTTEAPVYRHFGEYARDELIMRYDAILNRSGQSRDIVGERLHRAVANTLSADVPGLLPPQHLTEIIDVISTLRPIVSSSRQITLTNGTLTYPKITQRPTVAKQAAEKTEAASQKMDVAMQSLVADTYLGAGDLSWQTINWGVPDALNLWFQLAAEAYAMQTEARAGAVLIAAGTVGGSTQVAADDYPSWYSALVTAAGKVYARVRRGADTIWADIATAFTLGGFVSPAVPVFGAAGSVSIANGAGSIAGMRLIPSPGLNPDQIIVGNSQFLLCGENGGAPVEMRAVEPSIGGMEVGVIGAFQAVAMDPEAFELVIPFAGTTQAARAATPASGK